MTLAYYLKSRGYGSVPEVAKLMGVSQSTLRNWWNRKELRDQVFKPKLALLKAGATNEMV